MNGILMKVLAPFFKPAWMPYLKTGDKVNFKANELEKYSMKYLCKGIIQDRRKNDPNHYYRLITKDLTDHKEQPLELHVHEDNIFLDVSDRLCMDCNAILKDYELFCSHCRKQI